MKGSVPEKSNQGWQVVGLGAGLPPMARKLRIEYADVKCMFDEVLAAAQRHGVNPP